MRIAEWNRLFEGRRTSKHAGTDHVEVARLLIAAGCPLGWTPPEGAPSAEGTLEGLAELRKAAERRKDSPAVTRTAES